MALVVVMGKLFERMGTAEFDIAFAMPPEEFGRLGKGLRVVFAGFGSLVEYPAEPIAAADGGA